jgi:hypothetical protein
MQTDVLDLSEQGMIPEVLVSSFRLYAKVCHNILNPDIDAASLAKRFGYRVADPDTQIGKILEPTDILK